MNGHLEIGIWILAGIVVFLLASSLTTFLSAIYPNTITTEVTPKDFGYQYTNTTITTEDNRALDAWVVSNKKNKHASLRPLIIVLHGYPADKGDVLGATMHLAKMFDLLYIDFRGLGNSEDSLSTLGLHEKKDLQAAIAYAKREGYENIGLWGFSVGGAVSLMQAPGHDSIEATVAVSSYANLTQLASDVYPIPILGNVLAQLYRGWAWIFFGADIANVAPERSVRNYNEPVFVIHPRGDTTVPFSHAQKLQNALADNPDAAFWFPDGTHGQYPQEVYKQKVKDFFDSHLQ